LTPCWVPVPSSTSIIALFDKTVEYGIQDLVIDAATVSEKLCLKNQTKIAKMFVFI
jgi:hypothetical protein